jgi:hypothetical protein
MATPSDLNEPPTVPACPECGKREWEYREDWSGQVIYSVDATGWGEGRREGESDSEYWSMTCQKCDARWSYEDGDRDGALSLREALYEFDDLMGTYDVNRGSG